MKAKKKDTKKSELYTFITLLISTFYLILTLNNSFKKGSFLQISVVFV